KRVVWLGIKTIKVENFKSIKNVDIRFERENYVNCFLRKNRTGKSNLLSVLRYFYMKLSGDYSDEEVVNKANPYIQHIEIRLLFDFTNLLKKSPNLYINKMLKVVNEYLNEKNQLLIKMKEYKDGFT